MIRLRLTPSSGVPIYRQIIDQVAYRIASGHLRAGDRLPSVRELARALPANQNTVLKAYDRLENDGLIVRRHGDGTFVADGAAKLPLADRRHRVRDAVAHAAATAAHLRVGPDELRQLLEEEMTKVAFQSEDAHV